MKTAPQTIAEVKLIPIDLIDVAKQFREEFDQESINELAEDIKERGLLQPIQLMPIKDRYRLILGERRLRAVQASGVSHIPALISEVSADDFELMQLAENIQREELNHEEEVKAVKLLYKKYGSLAEVSKRVKKSISWVSKRYSSGLSMTWMARELLEEGITEDFDLLKSFEQYYSLAGHDEAKKLKEEIKKGNAGRNVVRHLVKELKAKAKAKEEAKAKKVSHAKPKKETPWITFHFKVKHLKTGELIALSSTSAKTEPKFDYWLGVCNEIGLDAEIWKEDEKLKDVPWKQSEGNENE